MKTAFSSESGLLIVYAEGLGPLIGEFDGIDP